MTIPSPVTSPRPSTVVPPRAPAPAMGQSDVVQISHTAKEKEAASVPVRQEQPQQRPDIPSGKRAVLALDDDKNVVVRVMDEKGKVIRQMPPEDYMNMMKQLRELSEQLFHVEV